MFATPRNRRRTAATLLALALAVTGCSDEAEDPPPSTTTASPTEPAKTTAAPTTEAPTTTAAEAPTTTTFEVLTTTPDLTPQQQDVAKAVSAAVVAMEETMENPGEEYPGLGQHLVEPLLTAVRTGAASNAEKGHAFRKGDRSGAAVAIERIEVRGSGATVHACFTDDSYLVDLATGEVIEPAQSTMISVFELVIDRGVWKVSRWERTEVADAPTGCDE